MYDVKEGFILLIHHGCGSFVVNDSRHEMGVPGNWNAISIASKGSKGALTHHLAEVVQPLADVRFIDEGCLL